jgi:raffinose/stachyose/melibiose transport system permease protein
MAKIVGIRRLKTYWPIYLFALPSVALIATLAYYPAASALYHAFYRWDCSTVEEFIGLQNFARLLGWEPLLWVVFAGWVCLMMMTLTRKPDWARAKAPWALVGAGVVVWLLFLTGSLTGTSRVLSLPPGEAAWWFPTSVVCTLAGALLVAAWDNRFTLIVRGALVLFGFLWFFYNAMLITGDRVLWLGFGVTFIFVVANLVKMIPSIVTAVMIHRLISERWQYVYRVLFVVPMIIPGMVYLLLWKFFYDPTQGLLNRILNGTGLMDALVWMDNLVGLGVFHAGTNPSWLGDANLVIFSLIFWGFPWVGVVGVLIYLSGLSSISKDVYEAADIDGINWFQKFLYIELPLITTQVRINLILMIIGTLKGYGNILVILGDGGGPKGVALVPGLYMFRNAFRDGYAGYACAIGLIIFVFILILTEINNRYVRVEK